MRTVIMFLCQVAESVVRGFRSVLARSSDTAHVNHFYETLVKQFPLQRV
jgi:hypothetical protein